MTSAILIEPSKKRADNANISYEYLSKERLNSVTKGFSKNFARHEAMGSALLLNDDELYPLFENFISKCLEHSFVAIDKRTNKVVGALIAHDYLFFKHLPPINNLSEKVQTIIAFLAVLEKEYENIVLTETKKDIQPNNIMYHYTIYVKQNYSNMGIGTNLLLFSETHSKLLGFKEIITIATGVKSQSIYKGRKLQFTYVTELEYNSFKLDDKYVFSNLLQPKTCKLLIKKLN